MQNDSLLQPIGKGQPASAASSAGDRSPRKPPDHLKRREAPSILLTATLRWPIAARLAITFSGLGCRVEAICPRQHPVTKIRAIRRIYPYAALMPMASLRAAIIAAAPDLIIPCDDDAAVHLHQLYTCTGAEDSSTNALRALIARSLGTPEASSFATTRGQLMALAAEVGVRVPDTVVVATPGELHAWLAPHGFPAVIKIDRTWGGQGVAVVHSHVEAQRAFAHMALRPTMANAVVRMLLDRDPFVFLNTLKKKRHIVTVQDFIPGAPANRAVACWQGKVLAGISVEALRTQHPTGPATVVRVIENPEMAEAVDRMVRRLGISGLWGADFILEASTGAAYLVEMNPRATPICHLALGVGQDLPVALYTQLMEAPPRTPPARIDHDIIAIFPGEWQRDPASAYLISGYHDIPLDEPALIRDCIDRPWSERGLIARAWARIRSQPPISPTRQKDSPGMGRLGLYSRHDHLNRSKVRYFGSAVRADKKTTSPR